MKLTNKVRGDIATTFASLLDNRKLQQQTVCDIWRKKKLNAKVNKAWAVPLGRKDGLTANRTLANAN
ncbi:hypothetical protein QQP08_024227 [Theobroma cacao]|nr:hypothetical protein QQP08_024227 [Theobroma cacao]